MHKVELLAPAGNFQCLVAAVQSGADAVYLAGKCFGARSFADNFDNEELERAVDYCHLRGAKVYVTVNTLVSDTEMEQLEEYLVFLSKIGVDAIIVQDMGVIALANRIVPELPLHASTQMTIHNLSGVEALRKYNIKRAVLSRELSIKEIKNIADNTDIELEVFGHGALCMCYSGQCLLSSIIGGRSGNRGKCAQPCRLLYSVNNDGKKAFYMSLKDLSSLEHLGNLCDAGISSLKIEGRMKGPAYVAAVVGIYRKYIDSPQKVTDADYELLDTIFNRGGLTDGYLTGKTGKEMFALDKPDNPYRMGSSALEKELLTVLNGENRKLRINGKIEIAKEKSPVFTIWYKDTELIYIHDKMPEDAIKSSLDAPSVINQLIKTGNTPYEFENITADVEDGLYLAAGELNKIRRNALEEFEKVFLESFKRKSNIKAEYPSLVKPSNTNSGFVCEVTTAEQLKAVKDLNFKKIYVPIEIIKRNYGLCDAIKDKIIIVMPSILRDDVYEDYVADTKEYLDNGFHGVQIQNIALAEDFSGYNVYGGFRLNVFNSLALDEFRQLNLKTVELSPELNLKQVKAISKSVPVQAMVYGRLPLMVTENCIIRNGNKCPCKGDNTITDRMGMKFPVIKDGEICRSVVLNCKKTFMAFDMDKIKSAGIDFYRIYFTDETCDECKRICDTYLFDGDYRPDDFTKGHFLKGVS